MKAVGNNAQAVTEYLLAFIAIALLTLVSISEFYPKIVQLVQDFFIRQHEMITEPYP